MSTAKITRSAAGHEVIYGPVGCGKTFKAKERIDEDIRNDRSVWIIDLDGQSLPSELDLAGEPATTVEEARRLLDAAQGIRRRGLFGRRRRSAATPSPITVTIEEAPRVLADPVCRRRMETLLKDAEKYRVRVRLVVRSLALESFGGSDLIRSAFVGDNAVERAVGVYRGMTESEREHVFRETAAAVAEFDLTGDSEPLTVFAAGLVLTIQMRLIPGYQDAVHASQLRHA